MKLKNISLIFLVLYIVLGAFIQYEGTSTFKSLPSPIYGGDYYYQMGAMYHVRCGGNPLDGTSIPNTVPGYLPVYGTLCAIFSNIFGLNTFHGMIYFSIVIFIISSILWFILYNKLFKNNWVAVLGVLLTNGINLYPILKYNPFTRQIMIPLFILALYLAFKEKKVVNFIFLGIIYGLLTLSHMIAFAGASLLLIVFLIYELYANMHNIVEYVKKNYINYLAFFISSIPIIMLYWYRPIFVYGMKKCRIISIGNGTGVQVSFFMHIVKSYLFNFDSFGLALITILLWIGIFALIISKNKKEENEKFIDIFLIGSIFSKFSYFITRPLLHTDLFPNYMASFYLWTSANIVRVYGLNYVFLKIKNIKNITHIKHSSHNDSYIILIFLVIYLILFSTSSSEFITYINNNMWANTAKEPLPNEYLSLQQYLLQNTNVNDVILSTKELSFAVNSISGRKLMVNRWAQQNNPFINMGQRDIDAAILLYGDNTKKKIELIKKYHIKYLYWDKNWNMSEMTLTKNGTIDNIFDPLLAGNNKYSKKIFNRYNISYINLKTSADPSKRNTKWAQSNILAVSPSNYHNSTNPWKPDLNPYLVEVWSYTKNGTKTAVLYKIEIH